MTTQYVSSGTIVSGVTVTSGQEIDVLSGGKAEFVEVDSGGSVVVSVGGTLFGAGGGGEFIVSSGGYVLDADPSSGGLVIIASGGLASASDVAGGSDEIVSSGGVLIETLLMGGTIELMKGAVVSSGFFGSGTLILDSGYVFASGGSEFGGTVDVTSGAVVDGAGFGLGTNLMISSGGVGTDLTLTGGEGVTLLTGAVLSASTLSLTVLSISSGTSLVSTTLDESVLTVIAGGSANNTTVDDSFLTVSAGGSANNTTVNGSGVFSVGSGGTANGVTVNSGGVIAINPDSNVNNLVFSGGGEEISDGYTAYGLNLTQDALSGLAVASGGNAQDIVVNSGARLVVASSGSASGVVVSSGGVLEVLSGGTASASIASGGTLLEYGGASVSALVNDSNLVLVSAVSAGFFVGGGVLAELVLSAATLSSSSVIQSGVLRVSSGGLASGISISSGGNETVNGGGTASGTTVSSGGEFVVLSGGTAAGTTVSNGGEEIVSSGGGASGVVVSSGGVLEVLSGGTASASIASGGTLLEYGGASVSALVNDSNLVLVSAVSAGFFVGGGVLAELVLSAATLSSSSVIQSGVLRVSSGGLASGIKISSGGNETVNGGGTASGTTVSSGGEFVVLSGGTAAGTTVSNGGLLILGYDGSLNGTDLLPGGEFDLPAVRFANGGSTSFDPSTDVLTITEAGSSYTEQMAGDYTGETFNLSEDSIGGTIVMVSPPCYCRGTLIRTDMGDVAVDALSIGDRLLTASGERRPVKWIGHRGYTGRFLAANPNVQPIRFRAGSLGAGLPRRDLLVSPEHAMFMDGLLIPARCLVNGSTIVQERANRVDYYHVELDSHDVLLAEGAPSESFIDDDSRGMFHNAAEFAALYPNTPRSDGFCAPRVEQGPELEAIRRRLAAVAGEIAVAA